MPRLPRAFFARPTLVVARELLGQRLVCLRNGRRLSGLIAEAEAYIGENDLACHARVGRTPRNEVMYGPPGYAYVYFTYGLHWMLNCVTERDGFPAAVLLRVIVPDGGVEIMRRLRGQAPEARLANGPAKLTQALGIDGELDGHDLCARGAKLFIERAALPPDSRIIARPRVGLGDTPEPWKSKAWNFRWLISD
ncbi:MAG: DNA-3-methyladenine glycosylase [Chloroflexi bacterium]|nr:DNA-3-methyladenine glycosylase [Chloroflexota bacterium]MBI3763818.1 DNA-3-methyladenine glycosylase [Chloroflexota bacterium]